MHMDFAVCHSHKKLTFALQYHHITSNNLRHPLITGVRQVHKQHYVCKLFLTTKMSTKLKMVKCKKFTTEKKIYGRQKIANHGWWSIKILEYSQWEDALQTVGTVK